MAVATANKPDAATPDRKHNIEAMRQDYYARIAKHGMTPLWKVMSTLFRDEPVSRCAPAVWHFDDVKSLVDGIGRPDHDRRGQAPGADPGESGAARRSRASPTRCSPAFR